MEFQTKIRAIELIEMTDVSHNIANKLHESPICTIFHLILLFFLWL